MIDFRYHLVSIVAVFLALAVGIVLGAGSLGGNIQTTLADELNKLRDDKSALNAQLSQAQRDASAAGTFGSTVAPGLIPGTLDGRSVVLVAGPGADGATVRATQATLSAAGATVTTRMDLTTDWFSSAAAAKRGTAVRAAAATLGVDTAKVEADDLPGTVLGELVLGQQSAQIAPDGAIATALSTLARAGLVGSSEVPARTGTLAVLVPGPLPTSSTAETSGALTGYRRLAATLDAAGDGLVAAAPRPAWSDVSTTTPRAVITGLRSDGAVNGLVSTVDDADNGMGQVALALALAEQADGGRGAYGNASDADAPAPTVSSRPTATATSTSASTATAAGTATTSATR